MADASQFVRVALVGLLVVGCFLVLQPFLAGVLFAAVICVSTWPAYRRLWAGLGRRDALAALAMTLLLLIALIAPMAYLTASLADTAVTLFAQWRPRLEHPQPYAPDWLRGLPLVGEHIGTFWQRIAASHDELLQWLSRFYEPARKFVLQSAQLVGSGLLQLLLVAVIAFFFYRDGARMAAILTAVARGLGGELGEKMLGVSSATVKAVMLGIFGTALAQAGVAWIGFMLAGAPSPLLLASATFFLSMIPVGPPLVWGGAALWLFDQGRHGWGIFMLVYGVVAISGVDNVLKPLLISHSARLPLLLIALGVLGGALAFGFVGIFLGPVLLALGLKLTEHWIASRTEGSGEAS